MGVSSGNAVSTPINELVALLNDLGDTTRNQIIHKFPDLADELNLGVWAGEEENISSDFVFTKALFAQEVLGIAIERSEMSLLKVADKITVSNRIKLIGQLAAVAGSSSAIGAIGLNEIIVAQFSAALALLGSVSGILSNYIESTISKKAGSLSEIYLRLSSYNNEAVFIKNNLTACIEHKVNTNELKKLISSANGLSKKINLDALQITQDWLKTA